MDDAHESDLEVVAYAMVASEDRDGAFDLVRWSSPHLPDGLDRSYPRPEDEGAFILAHDVGAFGVRFLDEDGAWHDTWDSSQLIESSELPLAAEISIAVLDETFDRELAADFGDARPAEILTRVVALPMRPIDLSEILSGETEDQEPACITVGECRARNPEAFAGIDADELTDILDSCWIDHLDLVSEDVEDCDDPEPG
jgi:hypothetical protein